MRVGVAAGGTQAHCHLRSCRISHSLCVDAQLSCHAYVCGSVSILQIVSFLFLPTFLPTCPVTGPHLPKRPLLSHALATDYFSVDYVDYIFPFFFFPFLVILSMLRLRAYVENLNSNDENRRIQACPTAEQKEEA